MFFGATGDLAYKEIFPALHGLVERHRLDIPVIGVANSGWDLDRLRARARDSLEQHGSVDPDAFTRLRQALGDAKWPLHYLAIPPSMFATVMEGLPPQAAPGTPAWSWRSRSGAT